MVSQGPTLPGHGFRSWLEGVKWAMNNTTVRGMILGFSALTGFVLLWAAPGYASDALPDAIKVSTTDAFSERVAAAEGGDTTAQFDLGRHYFNRDQYKLAIKWFREAAVQNHPDAQNYLGHMYEIGRGVPQHYLEALKWYEKAAEQNNTQAQYNLGKMHENGYGVSQDLIQAHMWYNLAGSTGLSAAIAKRNALAKNMTPEQIAEAQTLAQKWAESHP